jgi:hypothetical protein
MSADDSNDDVKPRSPDAPAPQEPAQERIGYKRPPRARRYPKGVSGNPHGRPKGARGRHAEIAEVMDEKRPIAGSRRTRTARKAMLLKQREKAVVQGDTRAFDKLMALDRERQEYEDARASESEREALDNEDLALIDAALARLKKPEGED